MNTRLQVGAVSLSVLVAMLMLGGTQEGQAQKKAQEVLVVNSTAEAIPTIAQVATTVTNPLWVRDVTAAPQPFQGGAVISVPEGLLLGTTTVTTVPAGKRLVIEYASANLSMPTGEGVVELVLQSPPGTYSHYLTPTFMATSGGYDILSVSQPLKLYANGGNDVLAALSRNGTTGAATVYLSISGYLIDTP